MRKVAPAARPLGLALSGKPGLRILGGVARHMGGLQVAGDMGATSGERLDVVERESVEGDALATYAASAARFFPKLLEVDVFVLGRYPMAAIVATSPTE